MTEDNNKHLLSHSFWKSGIWQQLRRMVLVQGLSRDCSVGINWGGSHLKSWLEGSWGWRVHFEDGSLTWMVTWLWLFPPAWFSIGLLECPHDVVAGFHHSEWSKREQTEATMSFTSLPLKSHHVTSSMSCSLLNSALLIEGGNYTQTGMNSRRGGSRVPSWRLATTGRPYVSLPVPTVSSFELSIHLIKWFLRWQNVHTRRNDGKSVQLPHLTGKGYWMNA